MPYYAITNEQGSVLRVDEAPSSPVDLEPGLTATALPDGQTPQMALRAGPPIDTSEVAWANARRRRDRMLAACDWITVRAVEQGQPVPNAWSAYRQALRDITDQEDPFNLTWPEAPA